MRARGLTLIEMTVALAISAIAVGAGLVLLIGSQRAFQQGTDERAIQETARVALQELSLSLDTAGYGLDPPLAFDMGLLADTVMDRVPTGSTVRTGGYVQDPATPCNGACRDRVDGPDELVFYARDPNYSRGIASTAPSTPSITLAGPVDDLESGQVLQLMCYGDSNQWLWAYVTVSAVDLTSHRVTLRPSPDQPLDFPYQNALLAQPCFNAGAALALAFKIERYRYYVAAVDPAGGVQPWETPGTKPYLMLDQGLSRGGRAVSIAVAPDVEDLQVAYLFPRAPAGRQALAETGGPVTANVVGNDDDAFNLYPKPADANHGIPTFLTPTLDPLRTYHQPANIRAVRVAITVRSPRADPQAPGATATVPAALNRPEMAGEPDYNRQVFETTVYVHNLEARVPIFPIIGDPAAGGCDVGNCGGG